MNGIIAINKIYHMNDNWGEVFNANELNEYFLSIYSSSFNLMPEVVQKTFAEPFQIGEISEGDILKTISKIKSNAVGYDSVSSKQVFEVS